MKKLLAFLLVISLVLLLVACEPKNNEPDTPGGDSNTGDNTNKNNPFGDNNEPIDLPLVDIDATE